MKILKLVIFIIILSSCSFIKINTKGNTFYASGTKSYYARIEIDNCYFFSAPILEDSTKMFILPKTYFVLLTSEAGDLFYSAFYDDISGYILKKDVKAVSSTPTNPYLKNINFRVFVPSGANLRSTPQSAGSVNLVYSIPYLDNNLSFLGTMQGEEAIPKKGNTWYYCKYFTANTQYLGYVYSPLCDDLTPISQNTEIVEYLTQPPSFETNIPETSSGFEGLSETATTIIIVVVSLPCLLFIYLLFKPSNIANNSNKENKTSKKKKISRLKHSDYFEYDDDF